MSETEIQARPSKKRMAERGEWQSEALVVRRSRCLSGVQERHKSRFQAKHGGMTA